MRPRTIDIEAATAEEARTRAAERFGVPPAHLSVEARESGSFHVSLLHAEAEVELEVTTDGMEARVTAFAPALGDVVPPDGGFLRRALANAGVTEGIDDDALAEAARMAATGRDITGRTLARGKAARPERPARFEIAGNARRPVLPGMVAGTLHPVEPGTPGFTVRGDPLPPASLPDGAEMVLGEGLQRQDDGATVEATSYGLLQRGTGTIELQPLFDVDEDGMEVRATLYAEDAAGNLLTPDRLREAFALLGFTHGFLVDGVAEALGSLQFQEATAREGDPAKATGVPLFHGTPPRAGEDARLEMLAVRHEPEELDATGRIDHHERSRFLLVAEGETIARIAPATDGTDGHTVRGEAIPAEPGHDVEVTVGANVAASEDGQTFTATAGGVVVQTGKTISITDLLEIPGDIDFSTGNIHLQKGSIRIKGGIRDGFAVEAPGGIEIGESIEGATVVAGGDVVVRQGLLLRGHGSVTAGGSVYARYAENSRIEAGGDIVVDNDLANCQAVAGGRIVATSAKGVIMGGTLRAAEGMEVNELGSELGVATLVTLGREDDERRRLQEELRRLSEMLKKVERVIGHDDARAILERTPPAKRKAVAEVIKAKMAILNRQKEAEAELEERNREHKRTMRAEINVLRMLHPGVSVAIAGAHATVDTALKGCRIVYDQGRDSILFLPLQR
ncbi:MAG: FapA family protein [Planctomycetota bacterium]